MRAMLPALLGCILLLFTSACSSETSSANTNQDIYQVINKGDIFPNLVLQDLSGNSSESNVLFANKVIVFNVWATWCPPCRAEMPDLVKLAGILDKLDKQHFMVIGLATDNDIAVVQQFANEKRLHFPIFWDKSGRQMSALGVHNYPTTYIIDTDGKVIDKIIGAYPWADKRVIALLKRLNI